MEVRLTDIILTVVVVGLFAGVIALLIANSAPKHDVVFSSNNNATLQTFSKVQQITNITEEIQSNTNISTSNSIFDILGNIFNQGWNAARITGKSMNLYYDMTQSAVSVFALGPSAILFKNALAVTFVVIIFITGLLAIAIKWPL